MQQNPMHISEVGQLFHDLTTAISAAQEMPRDWAGHSRTYRPTTARFKMKIWYRDGNARVYYSFDSYQRQTESFIDEHEGLKKLLRLALHHHSAQVKVVVVWASTDPTPETSSNGYNHEVYKCSKMGEKTNKVVSFKHINRSVVLDCEKLVNQSNRKM